MSPMSMKMNAPGTSMATSPQMKPHSRFTTWANTQHTATAIAPTK